MALWRQDGSLGDGEMRSSAEDSGVWLRPSARRVVAPGRRTASFPSSVVTRRVGDEAVPALEGTGGADNKNVS